MKFLSLFIHRTTTFLGFLGALAIIAMMLHITLDIILRSTLSVSIPGTLEIVTRYYMMMLALLPLGWVEWRRGMITVEALTGLYGEKGTHRIDILVAAISAGIYIVLTISTWGKAVEQYSIGSYVMSLNFPMPVWPTYFVLPVAFGLASLVALARAYFMLHDTYPQAELKS